MALANHLIQTPPALKPVTDLTTIIEEQVPITTPDFDRDVLVPLRQTQADEAAAEQAQIDAIATRVKPTGTYLNNYDYHQCTWYVASRVRVPGSMGDARNWGYGLLSAGFQQGAPVKGSIGVTTVGWAGHVVLVEQVRGGMVKISEYNYLPFTYDERWVPSSDFKYYS